MDGPAVDDSALSQTTKDRSNPVFCGYRARNPPISTPKPMRPVSSRVRWPMRYMSCYWKQPYKKARYLAVSGTLSIGATCSVARNQTLLMFIENITKQLPQMLHPSEEDSTGAGLLSLIESEAVEIVRINGTHYASYNESDKLGDQLEEIAETLSKTLAELETDLCERYWPEDDREDPRIVGYPPGSH